MLKILLLAIAIWLLFSVLKRYHGNVQRQDPKQPPEDMVRCAHCGVHLPKSDSLRRGDRYFCCEEHQEASHE